MSAFREFLTLLRFSQASLSVTYHEHAIERAKDGLAKAIVVRDQAFANLRIHEAQHVEPPAFLIRKEDTVAKLPPRHPNWRAK